MVYDPRTYKVDELELFTKYSFFLQSVASGNMGSAFVMIFKVLEARNGFGKFTLKQWLDFD